MGGNAGKMLKSIDNAEGGASKEIDKLFNKFDKDKSGELSGAEYDSFMAEGTKYMLADLKQAGHDYDEATIKGWLKQWIDPNGDGKISRAEMQANLKAVLDAGEN
eukprot:NODE_10898_length_572_cov_74.962138_g10620_i0.p1 GENE.NODE_10898_length_572_cov_74.962138_g10620_i0~~NODE_10898_length_572_cov_74.962138_g10620_i0.p1  ORF type:complete len:105 (+),score=43.70 NODE_10898_length_572_cov_74.962138_g10620_i0:73-387(+)